jgi:taurine--2-oxoglutarate transaminase
MSDWQAQQREHLFFTWSVQSSAAGMDIRDASGARFQLADGRWIWDFESQVYNVNAGHKHPHISQRMKDQIDALPACAPHALLPIRAELAVSLAELTGLHRAFLTCGGSEAVENAIKIARLVTGRHKVITRQNSYHGATLSVLGVAGDRRKAPFEAHLPPGIHIQDAWPPREATHASPSDWLESLQQLVEREGPGEVAAILLEGFTGTNGMQRPPADFWPGARELCDRHGILLIDDEIFSGFGRTGRWFARDHWGVRVDMMTLGKGLTSGYAPLAAVMVSEKIARHFDENPLTCGLTHYAHPVSCAAAMGSIEVLRDEGLVDNADAVGEHLRQGLEQLAKAHPGVIAETRGLGLMRALVLTTDAKDICDRLWELGVFAPRRENIIWLCPPLCIDAAGIDAVLACFAQVLTD